MKGEPFPTLDEGVAYAKQVGIFPDARAITIVVEAGSSLFGRVNAMPTYISLLKFTSQGITNIKDHPKRRRAAAKAIAGLGGKLVSSHLTLGRYDVVVITQAPDDETAAKFALMTGSLGNVSTETMRAFTEAEYDKLISSLP